MKLVLKKIVEKIPYCIGTWVKYIPFSFRLGRAYNYFLALSTDAESWDKSQKEAYVVKHFSKIFEYAKQNIPFYAQLYKESGVFDLQIKTISDIKKIPIVTKKQFREHFSEFKGAMLLNTGGTSGEPFQFYVDKNAFAREWAHMHNIWFKKGYSPKDLKITLRGKNLGSTPFVYNPIHNEFSINSYMLVDNYKDELITLFKKRKIEYIHGYPSAIYGFLKEIDRYFTAPEKEVISKNLKTCFLASEFPAEYMMDYISSNWDIDYISWYGHSEMCILAYDQDKNNNYKPFITYGLAENIEGELIGTSFHNFDMPLIRYNTGDLISSTYCDDSLMESFSITRGRVGDYVVDKLGKHISLTSFIFGRHHKVFEMVDYIQVGQKKDGEITLYLSTNKQHTKETFLDAMDLSNLELEIGVEIIKEPIRTKAGKLKLKITDIDDEANNTRP